MHANLIGCVGIARLSDPGVSGVEEGKLPGFSRFEGVAIGLIVD